MSARIATRLENAVGVVQFDYGAVAPVFDRPMAGVLLEAVRMLNADAACRAVVLAARGADFCAGGDCAGDDVTDAAGVRNSGRLATELFLELARAPKPIIVAVEGRAFEAGLALAAAADRVVAARDACFRSTAVLAGRLPDLGLPWSLARRVGVVRARRMLLSGIPLGAMEGEAAGLVSELTEPGAALAMAMSMARRYAAHPATAVALTRAALFNAPSSFDRALRLELDLAPLARQSADHRDAIAAVLETRARGVSDAAGDEATAPVGQ